MTTIVAATDGSAGAERAVMLAGGLCKSLGANLVLVTAAEPESSKELEAFGRAEGATAGDLLETICDAALRQGQDIARRAGATNIATRRTIGDPTQFILDAAKEVSADFIVVGKRGRGRLAGLLIGSVSQKLVSVSPWTVIVVP